MSFCFVLALVFVFNEGCLENQKIFVFHTQPWKNLNGNSKATDSNRLSLYLLGTLLLEPLCCASYNRVIWNKYCPHPLQVLKSNSSDNDEHTKTIERTSEGQQCGADCKY